LRVESSFFIATIFRSFSPLRQRIVNGFARLEIHRAIRAKRSAKRNLIVHIRGAGAC